MPDLARGDRVIHDTFGEGVVEAVQGDVATVRFIASREPTSLSRALTSNVKAQGNWGEVVLERLLEESGLHKGREYETQASFADQRGEGGHEVEEALGQAVGGADPAEEPAVADWGADASVRRAKARFDPAV